VGQHGQRKIVVEMRLDVIAHTLQPLRRKMLNGRQRQILGKMPSKADKYGAFFEIRDSVLRDALEALAAEGFTIDEKPLRPQHRRETAITLPLHPQARAKRPG
jgi:hypothetical protein